MSKESRFEKELEELINKHSMENASDTPDWILAMYLTACLNAYNVAVQQRESFQGRDPRPRLIDGSATQGGKASG